VIFAFLEDGTLEVHGSREEVIRRFEAADVESGAVNFYDESGTYLEASFARPRRLVRLLGWLGWRSRRDAYELRPNPAADQESFAIALYETISVLPNEWFSSVEQIKSELSGRGVAVEYQPW
jgi:hypothetical protein